MDPRSRDPRSGAPSATRPDHAAGLEHDALIYASDEEYLESAVPYVREGLEAGEQVSVITTAHNIDMLRAELGQDAAAVEFTVHSEAELTPARKLALVWQLCDEPAAAPMPRTRVVGEGLFGQTTRRQLEWMRYEAVLNTVFASAPYSFMCAHDRRVLPEWVLEMAQRTHPHVHRGGRRVRSGEYTAPSRLVRELNRELAPPPPPGGVQPLVDERVDGRDLAEARAVVDELTREATGSTERAAEVAVGLNEVLTNALEHGGDRAYLRCWRDDDRLVCEIADEGPGFDDPMAGFRPPTPEQPGGRGLWLARQLFDTVEFEPREHGGLRAHVAVTL